jgi:hypothetical protein
MRLDGRPGATGVLNPDEYDAAVKTGWGAAEML